MSSRAIFSPHLTWPTTEGQFTLLFLLDCAANRYTKKEQRTFESRTIRMYLFSSIFSASQNKDVFSLIFLGRSALSIVSVFKVRFCTNPNSTTNWTKFSGNHLKYAQKAAFTWPVRSYTTNTITSTFLMTPNGRNFRSWVPPTCCLLTRLFHSPLTGFCRVRLISCTLAGIWKDNIFPHL